MRLILKNLPKFITQSEIETHFKKYTITDIKMLKDINGNFRRIAYIGLLENSPTIIKKFNNMYIFNHKITVELSKQKDKLTTESEERQIKYNNKLLIKNLPPIPQEKITEFLQNYGEIKNIKFLNSSVMIDYKNNDVSLEVYKNLKEMFGKPVNVVPYKELETKKTYYNSLFFNFESVIKKTCDQHKIKSNVLIDLTDKDLGTKISLLETNLVNETDAFLKKNNIDLDKITDKKNKKVLIIRNLDINKAIDFVKQECKMEVSPSKNLILLKFSNEEDAFKCYKNVNLRRFNDQVVYCEFAPLCEETSGDKCEKTMSEGSENASGEEAVSKNKCCEETNCKHNKDTIKKIKMVIKNVPFQASIKDIENLFKNKYNVSGIRLPKKRDGSFRGFAFVTFDSNKSLKEAIKYFGKSTHLYGRRLVLEVAKE